VKAWAIVRAWLKEPMCSPAGLVVRAGMLALIYGGVSLLGFRNAMSMLSLTFPEGGSVSWTLFRGVVYLISHFLWILGVPILLIAAALMALLNRVLPPPSRGEARGGHGST